MDAAERSEPPAPQPAAEPAAQNASEATTALRREEAQNLNAGLARDLQNRAASQSAAPAPGVLAGKEEYATSNAPQRGW